MSEFNRQRNMLFNEDKNDGGIIMTLTSLSNLALSENKLNNMFSIDSEDKDVSESVKGILDEIVKIGVDIANVISSKDAEMIHPKIYLECISKCNDVISLELLISNIITIYFRRGKEYNMNRLFVPILNVNENVLGKIMMQYIETLDLEDDVEENTWTLACELNNLIGEENE